MVEDRPQALVWRRGFQWTAQHYSTIALERNFLTSRECTVPQPGIGPRQVLYDTLSTVGDLSALTSSVRLDFVPQGFGLM
jgi:hypothetical protein